MRVLAFGAYDPAYSRNRTLLDGLRLSGVDVVECRATLWRDTDDKVAAMRGGWLSPAFARRVLATYASLIRQYRRVDDYDVMLALYGSLVDVFLGRVLSRLSRRPLLFDVFMSAWVISKERGLFQPGDLRDRVIRGVEGAALRVADGLWIDTQQYVAVHQRLYGIEADKFRLIPTGSDSRFFYPSGDYLARAATRRPTFRVVYHGLFIPLHGTRWIVQAADRLRGYPDIQFTFIGDGHARAETERLAREMGLGNVEFTGRVPREALRERIADADIALGVFGSQLQGQVTIPNKIFEGMAMGKPVITGHTPAAADAFRHGAHVCFVPSSDPDALADAILALRGNPSLRAALAYGGHRLFEERYDLPRLGALARRHLEEFLADRAP
ncbi:MAG: glycosyltransferase family 4 protein [Anaerolineae bacterium]